MCIFFCNFLAFFFYSLILIFPIFFIFFHPFPFSYYILFTRKNLLTDIELKSNMEGELYYLYIYSLHNSSFLKSYKRNYDGSIPPPSFVRGKIKKCKKYQSLTFHPISLALKQKNGPDLGRLTNSSSSFCQPIKAVSVNPRVFKSIFLK